jgi:hypothetical protein
MGLISDQGANHRRYFGCAGIAFVALVFWMLIACCFLLFLLTLASELAAGDPDTLHAYYALLPMGAISAGFTLIVASIVVVFLAYGLYGRRRREEDRLLSQEATRTAPPLALPLVLAAGFLGSMMCAAGLPAVAFLPEPSTLLKGIALAGSGLFCLTGPLLLWFAVDAYERYSRD